MSEHALDRLRARAGSNAAKSADAAAPGRETLAQREGGQPLPEGPRRKYETTFGVSLGDVRVHTGAYAATLANSVNARAFAQGNDIYFNEGINPQDAKNEKLLAHEIAHTVQQRGASNTNSDKLATTQPGDSAERDAEAAAERAARGESATVSAQPASIARKTTDEKEEDEPVEVDTFADHWFTATKFALTKGGGLTMTDGGNMIRLQSPEIIATSTASVNLPKDKKLGSKTVQVGPIQTLMSSKRTAIYRKDGKTQQKSKNMGRIRDAAPVSHKDGTTTYSMKSEKGPFYSGNPNVEIHKQDAGKDQSQKRAEGDVGQADLGSFAGDKPPPVQVVMIDQPSMTAQKELPDGSKLIGTEGSDEFNTSAGFKTSTGQTFAKAPFGWRVSWNKTIDLEKPEDKAAAEKAAKDPKNDAIQADFSVKDAVVEETEVFAVQLANINSVEEASYRDLSWLVTNMPKAREVRPEAADFMEQAIANKRVTIAVTPRKTATSETSPSAKLNLEVTASITKLGATKSVQAMIGQTVEVVTTIGALANAAKLSLNESVHVAAHEWSSGTFGDTQYLGGTCSVPLPLGNASTGTLSGGDGSYDVTVRVG